MLVRVERLASVRRAVDDIEAHLAETFVDAFELVCPLLQ
jgi:hypothetical protein